MKLLGLASPCSLGRNELFAGVSFLACANGIGSRAVQTIDQAGWVDALATTFGVSAIVFIACGAGISFILRSGADRIQKSDMIVAAGLLVLVALPMGEMSWLALTGLSLYILLIAKAGPLRRTGAVILLATTVPMLWSRLLFNFFATFILEIDAGLVGWLLGSSRVGNMVRFADDSNYLAIFPACSSLANMSLAFLSWITISQLVRREWNPRDILWGVLACVSVLAVNVSRLSIMGLSEWHYNLIHGLGGQIVTNTLAVCFAVGISMLGVKRELFSKI